MRTSESGNEMIFHGYQEVVGVCCRINHACRQLDLQARCCIFLAMWANRKGKVTLCSIYPCNASVNIPVASLEFVLQCCSVELRFERSSEAVMEICGS